MKLVKGDTVLVTVGKDKGRQGKVVRLFPELSRVLVEGVNKYKRHTKPRGEGQTGSIVERERSLPLANVALLCTKCKQLTRIGFLINRDQVKTRICRKCKEQLS